jgi:Family of unknown function (DUF6522)
MHLGDERADQSRDAGVRIAAGRCANLIEVGDDGVVVDAALVADKLGLSPDVFWRELKRGHVYGVVERGEGDDEGRTRLTFNYRAQSWSVTVEGTRG